MTKLIFLRHGETRKNAGGVVHSTNDPDNASLTIFKIEQKGKFAKEIINSTDHLPTELKSAKK